MHVHTYVYMYIYIYIYIYICTSTYTHMHMYTYTHFPISSFVLFPCSSAGPCLRKGPEVRPWWESRNITFCFGVSKHHFLFRSLEMSLSVPHDAFCSARRFLFRTSLCVSHVTLCCAPCASRLALRIGRCVPLVPPQPPFSLISLGSSGSMSSGSCTIPASVMTLVLRFCR